MRSTRPRRSARSMRPVTLDFSSAEVAREVEHRRLAVAQDRQQAELDDREVVRGGDLAERGLDREGQLDERVDQVELGHRRGSRT